jgi:DNA adenine methylase
MARTKPQLRLVPKAPAAVKPLLKWAGGKSWFVKEHGDDLFQRVIERGGNYIEPFLGGAAMALHLGLPGMILGDAEEELITTYTMVRDNPTELRALLALMDDLGTDRESYMRVRETAATLPVEIAAKTIYLNRTCFNGLYRRNKSGKFNVPYGGEERKLPDLERILEVSAALRAATFLAADFQYVIGQAGEGDVIYADPPYHEVFDGYTPNGFGESDHERLAVALLKARARGAEFLCHNADTELVRDLFAGVGAGRKRCEIIETEERRSVNSKGDGRGPVGCVLIAGVDG